MKYCENCTLWEDNENGETCPYCDRWICYQCLEELDYNDCSRVKKGFPTF